MKLTLRLFIPLALSALIACNSDPPANDRDGGGGQGGDASEATLSAKKMIGTEGGSIAIDGASLDFPPGALTRDQEISVSRLDEADVAPLPAGAAFASPPVAFEPHGLAFEAPVTVNLDYSGGVDKRFVVAKLDDEKDKTWEEGAEAKFKDGRATFTINGFSIWAVVDDPDGALTSDAGSGGTGGGGGTGGTGGSGGSQTGTGPGSFKTTSMFGMVTLEGGGAVTATNVDSATALPYCVAGLAPPDLGGVASVGLKFDLGENGTTDENFTPSGDGLILDIEESNETELAITLHTVEGNAYCYRSYFYGKQFVVWEHFGENCNYESGPVYDPAAETIDAITILVVPPTEGQGRAFDFCIADIDDGYNGYLQTADFHGYVSAYQSGDATIEYGPEDSHPTMGACIGYGASTTGSLGLSWNLAQTVGGSVGAVVPTGQGLELDLYVDYYYGAADPRVYITDGTTEWCASLPQAAAQDNVPYFIPWGSFTTVCGGAGTEYAGQALRTLRVVQEGSAYVWSMCLYDALDTDAPVVGYFESGPWHGYPEVTTSGTGVTTLNDNLSWVRDTSYACMDGSIDAASTGQVTLIVPLDQDTKGGTKTAKPLAHSQLVLDNLWFYSAYDADAVLFDSTGVDYCAPLAQTGIESLFWDTFVDCDTGAPFDSGSSSVQAVGVRITADPTNTTYFDVCIDDLSETTPIPD